jgi:hypothetical protein
VSINHYLMKRFGGFAAAKRNDKKERQKEAKK